MRNRHPKWRPDWRIPASIVLLGSVLAWPGVAAAASCTVSPSNPTVDVGGTLKWSASISDMRSRRTYEWEFSRIFQLPFSQCFEINRGLLNLGH